MARKNCGCFGVHLGQSLRWWVLLEDVEFVALAWWTLRTSRAALRAANEVAAAPPAVGVRA